MSVETVLFDEHRTAHMEYTPLGNISLGAMVRNLQFFQEKNFKIDEFDAILKMQRSRSIPSLKLVGSMDSGLVRNTGPIAIIFSGSSCINEYQLKMAYVK